jgi:hypothetical protein
MKAHSHVKKLRKLMAQGKIPMKAGTVSQVHVAHDDWCRIFKGQRCNCDPDIRVSWTLATHSQN